MIYSGIRDANRAVSLFANTLKSATFNLDILEKRAGENFIAVTELADTIVRSENLPFRVSHEWLEEFLNECEELGVHGLSVTIPHKETILSRLTTMGTEVLPGS